MCDRYANSAADVQFFAELRPNRSLARPGFWALMTACILTSVAVGALFAALGAWPICGFFGLDLALLYWAFRRSYRDGGERQFVTLRGDRLEVRHRRPSGDETVCDLEPYWLRVRLDECPDRGWQSRLVLASHGRELTVGWFLSDEQRRRLCDDLRAALDGWKQGARALA